MRNVSIGNFYEAVCRFLAKKAYDFFAEKTINRLKHQ